MAAAMTAAGLDITDLAAGRAATTVTTEIDIGKCIVSVRLFRHLKIQMTQVTYKELARGPTWALFLSLL